MTITADEERWAERDSMFDAWRTECSRRRRAAKVSVAALARAAKISTSTLRRIEDDSRYWPTTYTIAAVSYALGWTLDDLISIFAPEPGLVKLLAMDGGGGLTGYEVIAIRHGAEPV